MVTTIKDVARAANLSISTISKYMNGGKVKEKNRIQIEKAVKELNYHPNNVARGLRNSKTYQVGLLVPFPESSYYSEMISEIERELRKMGYFLLLGYHSKEPERAKKYIDYLVSKRVDGIIMYACTTELNYAESAREAGIPIVTLEENYGLKDLDGVQIDCATAAYEAVEHLIKNNHKDIGIICGPQIEITARERYRGYVRVMEDYDIPVPDGYVYPGDYTYAGGYKGISALWDQEHKPTAVFVCNYDMGIGVYEAINKLHIAVPEELSIIVFDDRELSVVVRPQLTAIRQPIERAAKEACLLLEKRINKNYDDFPKRVRLKAPIIYRDSVRSLY